MRAYTVRKSGPNTDREFQTYVNLLEEIGIDIANVPRTPDPGTGNRWLYVWESKPLAERFSRELGARLRDSSWEVYEFEVEEEERGPLAPLTIRSISTSEGTAFRLEQKSLQRLLQYFPNARLQGEAKIPQQVLFPAEVREDFERQHGPVWDQVIIILTGLSEKEISRLGGIRILDEDGRVLHERLRSEPRRAGTAS